MGGLGAGKSTLSRKLSEIIPNSLLIVGDDFTREITRKSEKQILEKLGIEEDPSEFSRNHYFASLENLKTYVSIIEKDVIHNIELEIEKYENQKDYIIIDWAFLPLCDFFKKCDCTIRITTDNDLRIERLTERLVNKEKSIYNKNDGALSLYKPDIYLNRIKYTELINEGIDFDYYINNNSDIETFYTDINQLANNILSYYGQQIESGKLSLK